jgi:hypothetical protein
MYIALSYMSICHGTYTHGYGLCLCNSCDTCCGYASHSSSLLLQSDVAALRKLPKCLHGHILTRCVLLLLLLLLLLFTPRGASLLACPPVRRP